MSGTCFSVGSRKWDIPGNRAGPSNVTWSQGAIRN